MFSVRFLLLFNIFFIKNPIRDIKNKTPRMMEIVMIVRLSEPCSFWLLEERLVVGVGFTDFEHRNMCRDFLLQVNCFSKPLDSKYLSNKKKQSEFPLSLF